MDKDKLVERLCFERKWLIEQLAAAWEWTEQDVSDRLREDVPAALRSHAPK